MEGRRAYVHVVRGSLRVNDQLLETGDALALDNEAELRLNQGAGRRGAGLRSGLNLGGR